ncbi:MAG: hypothetical protein HC858_12195 [Brachymonas sp.]|nr:hypothetical protein [Brachymonas sp.]
MSFDPKLKAFAFLSYAQEYFNAAKHLKENCSARAALAFIPPKPALLCLVHSAELMLKSFLIFKGVSLNELRSKTLGHNQFKLYRKVRELGLPALSGLRLDGIRLILYANENHRLRYRSDSQDLERGFSMADWTVIEKFVLSLYRHVATVVYPADHDLLTQSAKIASPKESISTLS